jgi:dUTP pyrophosphatase
VTALPLRFRRLPHGGEDLPLPSYATEGSAGLDVRAAVTEDLVLEPGGRAAVPTGLSVAVPAGHELQVRPRSGLAIKHGLTCINSPGTVDSDYRGELKVLLVHHGKEPFRIQRGDRIAQLVLTEVSRAEVLEVQELDDTDRGAGGFGSTGR